MILIPNFLTACNLMSGCVSILLASNGKPETACWFVILSSFFDGIDGKVAHWLGQESEFGVYFDSFSDFVSFGIAPAFIFVRSSAHPFLISVELVYWVYILCCAFRLIRFHYSDKLGLYSDGSYFNGLPTTASGVCFASINLLIASTENRELMLAFVLLLLSALMVSHLRFYNPKSLLSGGRPKAQNDKA